MSARGARARLVVRVWIHDNDLEGVRITLADMPWSVRRAALLGFPRVCLSQARCAVRWWTALPGDRWYSFVRRQTFEVAAVRRPGRPVFRVVPDERTPPFDSQTIIADPQPGRHELDPV